MIITSVNVQNSTNTTAKQTITALIATIRKLIENISAILEITAVAVAGVAIPIGIISRIRTIAAIKIK